MVGALASAMAAVAAAVTMSGSGASGDAGTRLQANSVRGTKAARCGPNLVADSGFESMEARAFTVETPFRVVADPRAHTGKADVQATLSRSGKRIYAHVSTWRSTNYVSIMWVRGSGSGTLFVAADDLSQRLAATTVRPAARWRQVSLACRRHGSPQPLAAAADSRRH